MTFKMKINDTRGMVLPVCTGLSCMVLRVCTGLSCMVLPVCKSSVVWYYLCVRAVAGRSSPSEGT